MALVLRHTEIAALLDRQHVFDAVEAGLADLSTGIAQNPAPTSMDSADDGRVIPMMAQSGTAELAVVKVLSDLPGNRDRGLPRQRSTLLVTSTRTGQCVAVLDGRAITAIRTAAASAVATKRLARPGSSVLGVVGAGNLAIEHVRAIVGVRDIDSVVVWSRSKSTVEKFRAGIEDLGLEVTSAHSVEQLAREADIICTLTPSVDPILCGRWLTDGTHLNVVGAAPRPDEREVDGTAMARSRIIVDSRPTALSKSGDAILAIAEGAIAESAIDIELGDVITGRRIGRSAPSEITLFDSTGIGLEDLVVARLVIDRALELDVGTQIDLSS
ncbi:ornithine cyclodeaminase family protein [Rhodococcus sp. IEGM 1366]|uniref:ornithine cyclodeaminase family protein n=1 Tax=Rhodococcus sp. IEGM 1366 TaxID=3082223 RepID=UPI002953DCB8|nr:ornithine cyclodeaminase family protein [Rhodococcus sp. IEGM 1366]MDV8071294.1 ornithine cyclodeaminase family protein [Rhodococcus sp. IEGM 1366]